nr:MAG TPA: hypothetical protein [Caudoviricetes sp.]
MVSTFFLQDECENMGRFTSPVACRVLASRLVAGSRRCLTPESR